MTKPKKHPGGRPTFYGKRMVKISVMIPDYQYDHLCQRNKAVSEALRVIIEKDINNANQFVRSADVKI